MEVIAVIGILAGTITGAAIASFGHIYLAKRRERLEFRTACRLVATEFHVAQLTVKQALEAKHWWRPDEELTTEAWKQYKIVLRSGGSRFFRSIARGNRPANKSLVPPTRSHPHDQEVAYAPRVARHSHRMDSGCRARRAVLPCAKCFWPSPSCWRRHQRSVATFTAIGVRKTGCSVLAHCRSEAGSKKNARATVLHTRVMGITRWLGDETGGGLDVEHTRKAQTRRVSAKLLLMNVDFLKLDVGITARAPGSGQQTEAGRRSIGEATRRRMKAFWADWKAKGKPPIVRGCVRVGQPKPAQATSPRRAKPAIPKTIVLTEEELAFGRLIGLLK